MTLQPKIFLTAVILAGGRGKRMEGNIPKVLIEVEGKPMIKRIVEAVSMPLVKRIIVVVGIHHEEIKAVLPKSIDYVYQDEPKGTADAFIKALEIINNDEINLILPADLPYLDTGKVKQIIDYYLLMPNLPLVVGMKVNNPTGYGRLFLNEGMLFKIIEEKQASEEQKKINIINTGIYVFPSLLVRPLMKKIKPHYQINEFYLTDLIALLSNRIMVRTIIFSEDYRLKGVNHLSALQTLIKEKNR